MSKIIRSRRAFFRQRAGAPAHNVPAPPFITPTGDFFTAQIGNAPRIDCNSWTLTVDGLVNRPLKLDLEALRDLPAAGTTHTLACIGNTPGATPLVGNADWRGVPVKRLLDRAGVQWAARRALFHAADGYTTAVDLWWLHRDGALLAYEMNGAPLPAAHGAPLRLLTPGLYGQKAPKWITRIELIDDARAGYWERRGWSDVAAVQTCALFTSPPNHARVTGALYLHGVAYAGDRAITQVEVSADAGPWQPADLTPPDAPQAWTVWRLRWEPNAPGLHTFRVRATDARGFTQTAENAGRAYPAGSATIDRLALLVV